MERMTLMASALLLGLSKGRVETIVTKVGLAEDLGVLRRAYSELHPGLLRYNSEAKMNGHYKALEAAWGHDQTLREAYLALSEFLAQIKCGHTYANFFNQDDKVAAELFDKADRVPFLFRWIDGKMVVTRDCSPDRTFPKGTEIVAINDVSSKDILAKLLTYARADGNNMAKRVSYLELIGEGKYEAFDVLFSLAYQPDPVAMSFKVRLPDEKAAKMVTANGIAASARGETVSEDPASPAWTWEKVRADIAVVKMPTWAMYNRKWDWKSWLNRTLDEVSSVPNLVFDLRGNEGGDSVGDEILKRLVRKPVASEQFKRYTKYRRVPDDLRPYVSTWDKSFYDWGEAARPSENGLFRMTMYDDDQGSVVKPEGLPYRGQVYVLVGPANSSATFEFSSQVKALRLGTLVGQTTGGSQRGINGGAFLFLTLPNSKLEADIPLIAQFYDAVKPDGGVKPDIAVKVTVRDIARGRDAELEAVFRDVDKRRSKRDSSLGPIDP